MAKTLENYIDVTLNVNEPLRWGMSEEELIYAGMVSRDSFALAKTDVHGKNPRTLFFPAKSGVIRIWSAYSGGHMESIDVKEVTPEYITLTKGL